MLKNVMKYTVLPVVLAVMICALVLTKTQVVELFATASEPDAAPQQAAAVVKGGFSAKGCIQPPDAVYLLAPMGGQVKDFSWSQGDSAALGDVAFELLPTQVYAGADGVVRSLKANVGDQVLDVMQQYGALCYIERDDVWHVDASTSGAYDDPDNRDIRVGQRVRIQHGTGDSKVRSEGTVISVDGKDYVVELLQGDFEKEDSVKLYLETSKDNANKDQVGSGKIVRAAPLAAQGEGVVAGVLVAEGDKVTRGQPLFILDSAGARYAPDADAKAELTFAEDALIQQLLVTPGEFVRQGQTMAQLLPTGHLEATLDVDELDIAKVHVGQTVRVKVDSYDGERTGTVTEVRAIGQTVLDTTKFPVKVQLDQMDDLMIGMHVTGYWD